MPTPNGNNNYKNKCIPLEDIKLGEPYAISINADKITGDIQKDYKQYTNILYNLFDCSNIDYEVYFEFSPIGKLHLHGIFMVHSLKDIGELFQRMHNVYKLCASEIDSVDDLEKWLKYCQKQRHVMKPYLNKYKLHSKLVQRWDNLREFPNKA